MLTGDCSISGPDALGRVFRLAARLLLDGDGTILKRWIGPVAPEEFEAAFTAALDG